MSEITAGFGDMRPVFAVFANHYRQAVGNLMQVVDVELVTLGEFGQVPAYLADRDSRRHDENVRTLVEHAHCGPPSDRRQQDVSVRGYAFYARRSHAQFL